MLRVDNCGLADGVVRDLIKTVLHIIVRRHREVLVLLANHSERARRKGPLRNGRVLLIRCAGANKASY